MLEQGLQYFCTLEPNTLHIMVELEELQHRTKHIRDHSASARITALLYLRTKHIRGNGAIARFTAPLPALPLTETRVSSFMAQECAIKIEMSVAQNHITAALASGRGACAI